jgi:hypothetical protein
MTYSVDLQEEVDLFVASVSLQSAVTGIHSILNGVPIVDPNVFGSIDWVRALTVEMDFDSLILHHTKGHIQNYAS